MTRASIVLAILTIFLISCSSKELSWPDIKRQIREQYPEVEQLSIDEYQKKFSHSGYLVDVREKEEFDVSRIRGAVNGQNADSIVVDFRDSGKEAIVLYCSVGHRSSAMAQ